MVPRSSNRPSKNVPQIQEQEMSKAAEVRRDFRLGRYPKAQTWPLHPKVVWDKASSMLSDFRQRMKDAGLKADDTDAAIVYISNADPDKPLFSTMGEGEQVALKRLSAPNVIAMGMVFRQFDAVAGKQIDFPMQFAGLSERGVAVLRRAVLEQQRMSRITRLRPS